MLERNKKSIRVDRGYNSFDQMSTNNVDLVIFLQFHQIEDLENSQIYCNLLFIFPNIDRTIISSSQIVKVYHTIHRIDQLS